MFYGNRGYVGCSRSVRSHEAIREYRVPLSMMTSSYCRNALQFWHGEGELTDEEYELYKSFPVSLVKYTAENYYGASEWHHTGKFYNQTDHYDLFGVYEYLGKRHENIADDFKAQMAEEKAERERAKREYSYGIATVKVFGGSVRKPKFLGYETYIGIIFGDWLYNQYGHKLKLSANKTESWDGYNTYAEFVSHYPKYKGTKHKVFGRILKQMKLKHH